MIYIRSTKDFYAGLVFLFFGIGAIGIAPHYQIGTAARMGPGYFPFLLGGALSVLGVGIILRNITKGKRIKKGLSFKVKPVFLVLSSVVLFGLLLRPLGFLISTLLLVFISSMASEEFKRREAILNAFILLILVLMIFVYFLKFQIPLWPSFLNR